MANQELSAYVKAQIDNGISREEITKNLVDSNWSNDDIDNVFNLLGDQKSEASSAVISSSQYSDFENLGKFARSKILIKESLKVLRMDKEIMWFPILSAIATIIIMISFMIPIALAALGSGGEVSANIENDPVYMAVLFAFYFVSYFVVIFFNVGLITCVQIRLDGGDPTFKDGINNAFKNIGSIFVWALLSATVGMILRAIAERSKLLGRIVVALIGAAWSMLTYFVIPVMIFEKISVFSSIKESGVLFKKTWGENFISNISMGLIFFLLSLLGFIPLIASFFTGKLIIIGLVFALVVTYWLILGIISASLKSIFDVALYNYARTGKTSLAFSPEIMQSAFKPKKK